MTRLHAIITDYLTKLARWQWRTVLPTWVALFTFYLLLSAGNLSETDDVYSFAWRAKHFPLDYISDPRLMLYHISMRLLYLGATAAGGDISALLLMQVFAVCCAALTLPLLHRILCLDFQLPAPVAATGALLLGLSYGFWRYAAEADVYIPAILLCLLVFHGLLQARQQDGYRNYLGWGLLAGGAVLFYQPSMIPLFLAFPLLLLSRKRLPALLLYGTAGAAVIVSGYLAGYLVYWSGPLDLSGFMAFLSQRSHEFMVPPLSLRTVLVSVVRSGFALSHDLLSANWLFGFDSVAHWINRAFSHNVIDEEVFLARQAGGLIYLPLIILPALAWVVVRLLLVTWPQLKTPWRGWSFPASGSFKMLWDDGYRPVLTVVAWLLLNGAVIGRLNPAGIEAWIMVLPPLVILCAVLVLSRVMACNKGIWVAAMLALMFMHNLAGGIGLVMVPDHEYDRVKGRWLIEHADPHDLLIVTDNAGLAESLRYLSQAKVALVRSYEAGSISQGLLAGSPGQIRAYTFGRDFTGDSVAELVRQSWQAGGRVVLFEEFLQPRFGRFNSVRSSTLFEDLRSQAEQVDFHPTMGGTYVIGADRLNSPL